MKKKYILSVGIGNLLIASPFMLPFNHTNTISKNRSLKNEKKDMPFHYTANNQFQNYTVSQTTQDKEGNIWVLAKDTSIGKFSLYKSNYKDHGTNFHKLNPGKKGYTMDMTTLMIDKSGIIWLGTRNSGLWVSRDNATFFQIDEFTSDYKYVSSVYEGKNGDIYAIVGNSTNALDLFRSTNKNTFTMILNAYVLSHFIDNDGNIWAYITVKGSNNLYKSTDNGKTFKDIPLVASNTSPYAIFSQNKNGDVFVGLSSGLFKSNNTGLNFKKILNTGISSLSTDGDGNIWVGTATEGLYIYYSITKTCKWFSLFGNVNILFLDNKGNTWASIDKGGLWKKSVGGIFSQIKESSNPIQNIKKIFEDKDKNIWISLGDNVATSDNGGLLSNIIPSNITYSTGATNREYWIGNTRNYLSNKKVVLNIDPADNITIDSVSKGKTTTNTSYTLLKGKHIISITKWNITYSFNIVVTDSINISNTYFGTFDSFTLSQYDGYILGDKSKKVKVKSVIGGKGANLIIGKFAESLFIDYSNSYYQKLNPQFLPTGSKINLNETDNILEPEVQTFYILHIQDLVGNFQEIYVQVGGTKNVIPENIISVPTEAKGTMSGYQDNATFTPTKVIGTDITLSFPVGKSNGHLSNDDDVTVTYKLNDGYSWPKGKTGDIILTYAVKNLNIGIKKPTAVEGNMSGYNGSGTFALTPITNIKSEMVFSDHENGKLENNDSIKVTYTPKSGYVWSDGTSTSVTYTYTVKNLDIQIVKPTEAKGSMSGYNGSGTFALTPITNIKSEMVFSDHENGKLENNDSIKVTYTPKSGYVWSDGTSTSVTYTYTVKNLDIQIVKPTEAKGSMTGYNGSGTFTATKVVGTDIALGFSTGKSNGHLSNGDNITVTYKLNSGYVWPNGTTNDVIFTYKVKDLDTQVVKPTTAEGSMSGNYGSGLFTPKKIANIKIELSFLGNAKQGYLINSSKIKITYTPDSGYVWSDGTSTSITYTYTIQGLKKV